MQCSNWERSEPYDHPVVKSRTTEIENTTVHRLSFYLPSEETNNNTIISV